MNKDEMKKIYKKIKDDPYLKEFKNIVQEATDESNKIHQEQFETTVKAIIKKKEEEPKKPIGFNLNEVNNPENHN